MTSRRIDNLPERPSSTISSSSISLSGRSYYTNSDSNIGSNGEAASNLWYTYPILNADPFIGLWNTKLRTSVIAQLESLDVLRSIDVVKRGLVEDPNACVPAIIITVSPDAVLEDVDAVMIKIQRYVMNEAPGLLIQLFVDGV